jgi:putative oxidoreductase
MRIDIGLLIFRTLIGAFMFFGHGLGKMRGFSEMMYTFPDPIGMGPTASLVAAIFAESVCAILIFLGLATRVAALPLLFTMLVAAGVVHAGDPWAKKELALLYAIPCLTLLFTGPGMFSIDALLKSRPKFLRP